jgi:hypothetical protein
MGHVTILFNDMFEFETDTKSLFNSSDRATQEEIYLQTLEIAHSFLVSLLTNYTFTYKFDNNDILYDQTTLIVIVQYAIEETIQYLVAMDKYIKLNDTKTPTKFHKGKDTVANKLHEIYNLLQTLIGFGTKSIGALNPESPICKLIVVRFQEVIALIIK